MPPHPASTFQLAAVVTSAPEIIGTMSSSSRPPSNFPTFPAPAKHLTYQQIPQLSHSQQMELREFWANQKLEMEQTTKFKNNGMPLARINKIMKSDEDVHMVSSEVLVLFAKACEVFIKEVTLRSWMMTDENKRRTLQRSDIAAAFTKTETYDFLIDIVPKNEVKEEEFVIPRAAPPDMGAPVNAMPYYYAPIQHPTAFYGVQHPPPPMPYAWPPSQAQAPQQQMPNSG